MHGDNVLVMVVVDWELKTYFLDYVFIYQKSWLAKIICIFKVDIEN